METAWIVIVWLVIIGAVVYWQGKKRGWFHTATNVTVTGRVERPRELRVNADIVGESHYQAALASIAGGKCQDGYCIAVAVELRREPTNPYDHNAVQCLVDGRLVGYINRDAAPSLHPLLQQAERRGIPAVTDGYISGGWRRRGEEGDYGVKLGPAPEYDDPCFAPRTSPGTPDKGPIGMYAGRHYTEYVELVKQLKRDNDLDAAEKLLLHLLKAVEEEAAAEKHTPAPWYYEQLEIVYRKQKRYEDEISVIGRHRTQLRLFGFDAEPEELARLEKAVTLRGKRS